MSQESKIEGHKANNQAKENNDSKNTWAEDTNGVRETQEGWLKGSDVENRQGEVKEYDTGKVIGSDGETWIRVHIDKNGNIHGYPVHKK